jgi:hypothetical protein
MNGAVPGSPLQFGVQAVTTPLGPQVVLTITQGVLGMNMVLPRQDMRNVCTEIIGLLDALPAISGLVLPPPVTP